MERRGQIGNSYSDLCCLHFAILPVNSRKLPSAKNGYSSIHSFGHSVIAFVPNFLVGAVKRCSSKHSERSKHRHKVQSKGNKISIFTGRGANKNKAIFEILDAKGPLPISDLQKILNKQKGLEITYYASLNKRITPRKKRLIAQANPAAMNQRVFKAALYEARAKFYLACFLNGPQPRRNPLQSNRSKRHNHSCRTNQRYYKIKQEN